MNRASTAALRLAGAFAVVAAGWTLFAEPGLARLPGAGPVVARWAFVALATTFVFLLGRRLLRGREALERKLADERAEGSSAENERLFRVIFEQAAVGIAQVAPDGRMLRINAWFCALVGRSALELRRLRFADFTHPDDLQADLALVARCLAGELDHYSIEKRYVRPDGSPVWVLLFVALVRDASGAPACFVSVASDITRRKAAEASLESYADQYKLLFAANPLPMFVYDLADLRIVAVNDTAVSHYGHTRARFLGLTIPDLHPVEDRPRLMLNVEVVRSGARPTTPLKETGVWRHLRDDGSLMEVEIASHVVDFEGRRCELVLVHDVTSRRRGEAELEAGRARLAGIIASAFDGIITADADLRIVAFNHAAETMFLAHRGEMIGRRLAELFPERGRAALHESVTRFLAGDETSRRIGGPEETHVLRSDGTEFPADLSISQTTTGGGRYVTLIVHDATERRRAAEAIRESRHRLQVAIEAAHLGFWDLDLMARRVDFSEEWKRLLGYSGDAVGSGIDELLRHVHPDDAPALRRFEEHLLATPSGSAGTELRFRHKDGDYREVLVRCTVLRDHDGVPTRVIGTTVDLTPMRDSERMVRRLSARILRLQDTERRRIARELHDTTAQNLAALNMNLARLARTIGPADTRTTALLEDSVALTDLCVQEIRTLAYLLHPPLLDDLGLDRAVVDYVRGFSERSGIPVELDMPGPIGRLPDEIELSLFRIIQEGLANVARHAACTAASVRLVRTGGTIELEIVDNGRGIPPEVLARLRSGAPLGVGVTGMSERLDQIGGRLELESRPGATTVRATVALEL